MASSEDRERLPRGLPEMILTRSLLFILLYLFSDRLTNCGKKEGVVGRRGRGWGKRAGQVGGTGGRGITSRFAPRLTCNQADKIFV